MSDSNTQAASAVSDQPAIVAATPTFRKLSKDDIGSIVLLQAIKRTYVGSTALEPSWSDAINHLVVGLRPDAVDAIAEGQDSALQTFVRSDVRVIKPVVIKVPKAPKVVKVGLDLCHDKTDTNPFGKVSLALAIERMATWTMANLKRGADPSADYTTIFMAAGQKFAPAMKDLRAQAAARYAGMESARDEERIAAKAAKAEAIAVKARAQLEALTAKVEAAKAKALVKTEVDGATKAKLIKEAQARIDAEAARVAAQAKADVKAARKAAKAAKAA